LPDFNLFARLPALGVAGGFLDLEFLASFPDLDLVETFLVFTIRLLLNKSCINYGALTHLPDYKAQVLDGKETAERQALIAVRKPKSMVCIILNQPTIASAWLQQYISSTSRPYLISY
jgi:hypothetical protein